MDPDVTADSSPATPTDPTTTLAALSAPELATWRHTGTLPESNEAGTTPAEPVEQAAPTDAISEPASEPAKVKKGKGVSARNVELDAEIQSLQEKLRIRKELDAELSRRGIADVKPAESSPAAVVDKAPKLEDFASGQFEEYIAAKSRWEARQMLNAERQQGRELDQFKAAVERAAAKATEYTGKVVAVMEGDPAFKARVKESFDAQGVAQWTPASDVILAARAQGRPKPEIPFENAIAQEIVDSHIPAELLDHLIQHPDVLDGLRVARDRNELQRLVGRLEGRIERGETPKVPVKTITGAPSVPSTVVGQRSGMSADPVQAAIEKKDAGAYIAAMNARDLAARKR